MDNQLFLSDESRLDILDAFSWYEIQFEGLGKDFHTIRNPKSWVERLD